MNARHVVAATAVVGVAAVGLHAAQQPTVKHREAVKHRTHTAPVKIRKHRPALREARFLAAARPVVTPVSRSEPRSPAPSLPPAVSVSGDVLEVTAYCWTGSRTASGVWPERGMAAGNDWEFGTRLRVEGFGEVTITDRYGYGTQLDLFLGHYDGCEHDALVFGRRHLHVEVVR